VAEKIPDQSSIQFSALAALDILLEVGSDKPNDWSDWAHVAFVQLADPTQASALAKQMDRYIAAHNALALGLAEIFVPVHDNMWTYFELTLDYSENIGLLAFLAGLLFFVGIVAGAYPAFYISAYHPVALLRGEIGKRFRLERGARPNRDVG
jgi:hypothetical protein